jgi:hypothetical protein
MALALALAGAKHMLKNVKKGSAVAKKVTANKKTSLISKVGKLAGVGAGIAVGAYGAEKLAERLGVRGGAGFIGKNPNKQLARSGKRRRGKVPKSVRKWASKIVSRRNQEEKIVKDLFGTSGGKVIKAPKKSASAGFISRSEAERALRN